MTKPAKPAKADKAVQLPGMFEFQATPWMEHAACQEHDTELFFAERGGETRRAKAICQQCPVIDECLAYALELPNIVGIWGGTSGKQRRKLLRDKPRTKPPIRHGTQAGYSRERREGKTPCEACKQANREAARIREMDRK